MKTASNKIDFIKESVSKLMPEDALLVLNVLNGSASDAERLVFVDNYLHLLDRVDRLERQTKTVSQNHERSDAMKGEVESSISRTTAFLNKPKNRDM